MTEQVDFEGRSLNELMDNLDEQHGNFMTGCETFEPLVLDKLMGGPAEVACDDSDELELEAAADAIGGLVASSLKLGRDLRVEFADAIVVAAVESDDDE